MIDPAGHNGAGSGINTIRKLTLGGFKLDLVETILILNVKIVNLIAFKPGILEGDLCRGAFSDGRLRVSVYKEAAGHHSSYCLYNVHCLFVQFKMLAKHGLFLQN